MKTTLTFIICVLITCTCIAQQGINYKAVIKDDLGNVVADQTIGIQFNIIQGSGTGAVVVYTEDHPATTNANGLVILNIGEGTVVLGDFLTIDWGVDIHFLNIKYDDFSGAPMIDLGTTEFKAVPYALEAANVSGLEALDEGNGIGWRLKGNIGNAIGSKAVDLGNSNTASGGTALVGGFLNTASGDGSVVFGSLNQATAIRSTAFGESNVASGENATVFGTETNANAYSSFGIGRDNVGGGDPFNWVATDPLFEIGNGTDSANKSNALTVLKNGTILAPTFDLGEITDTKALITKEYADTNYLDSNYTGSFETTGNVTSNSPGNIGSDDFVFGSDQLNDNNSTSSDNSRFFFDKSLGAFRAGNVSNDNWDATNIGIGSFAGGVNTLASGQYSIAIGFNSEATGYNAVAIGDNSIGSGDYSIAIGDSSMASGEWSTAIGAQNEAGGAFGVAFGQNSTAFGPNSTAFGKGSTAYGFFSTVIGTGLEAWSYGSLIIGRYNIPIGNPGAWVTEGQLFAIGFGSSDVNRANALTVLKNGKLYLTPTHDDAAYADNSGYMIIGEESGVNMVFDNNEIMARDNATASPLYLQRDGGNLSIGNVGVPNVALDVFGSIQYTGTITDVSDERLKENLKPIDNALDQISKISAYSYNMKADESKMKEYGVIAQELQKVFPEMVNIVDEENGYLGVSYIQLIPVMLEAMKEQQSIIEKQESKINNLTAEVNKKDKSFLIINERLNQLEKILKSKEQ